MLHNKIENCCKTYNKNKERVNLIAVSKVVTEEKIKIAIESGCKVFGENYIKEAKEKWPKIKEQYPEVELHLIGHLQSNKAKDAVKLFDVIQTLDSKKLALEIKKEVQKQQRNPQIFIQVNIGEEEQKGGIMPSEVVDFAKFIREECQLNLVGLMCVPPAGELASPYFALLSKLAKENNIEKLSMGMSADFEEAIALGADYIRVGTAIFGERKK